jgi:hypothetical protein
MSRGAAPEVTAQTRAWIRGKHDAEAGRERQAPSDYSRAEIEAYGSGYDSVSEGGE